MALFINNDEVKQILSMRGCLEALEQAYVDLTEGNLVNRPRIDLCATTDVSDRIYRWGTMEAVNARTGYHAIRMKSDIVYWAKHESGITEEKYCIAPGNFCGLIFLFSARNGEPLAIIHDGYLTHMRVGAIAALGVKYLARDQADTLGILGSGWMARSHSSAIACVRQLKKIKVFSPHQNHREEFASEMSQALDIEITPVDHPRRAVAGSDIVSACTDSVTPVLESSWLENGMHLTAVKPKGEWEEEVFPKIDVVFGGEAARPPLFGTPFRRGQGNFLTYAAGDAKILEHIPRWSEHGTSNRKEPRVVPLASMIQGKVKGRTSADEISASAGSGWGGGSTSTQGLPFVTLGAVVYEQAKKNGLGKEIPTELFIQDIRD
jgi:ornithine cyclodeaminase/alanine dehydrogenase-like protein (mu-crystallin family)